MEAGRCAVIDDVTLDADDVSVVSIQLETCECGTGPVTHAVQLDARANGCTAIVFDGCESCANEHAKRLRASLPKAPPR